jgi:hypothetical protein
MSVGVSVRYPNSDNSRAEEVWKLTLKGRGDKNSKDRCRRAMYWVPVREYARQEAPMSCVRVDGIQTQTEVG